MDRKTAMIPLEMTDNWIGWGHTASCREDTGIALGYRFGSWCGCGFGDCKGSGYGQWGSDSENRCYGRGTFCGSGERYVTGHGG